MPQTDLKNVRPYGDTLNDGKVQLSFTLPLRYGPEAKEAARQLAIKMGFEDVDVVSAHDLGGPFSYFIVYGKCTHSVDVTELHMPKIEVEQMDFFRINDFVRDRLGRKITVTAACTGSDAHTVGIDAIINMKGCAGEYGLERYPWFRAYNLGAQVPNEVLVAKAIETDADAILVSQIVTQKNVHIANLTRLVDLVEAEGIRDDVLLIAGGPRISHELALELGFDAGFGPGTLPSQVAAYIAQELVRKEHRTSERLTQER
ncbi:MAG: OAM dimerization domain-containing protein [Clostridia bacterium]|nr:OAM dimerization domain-containing protein [Clostridia bacterium]